VTRPGATGSNSSSTPSASTVSSPSGGTPSSVGNGSSVTPPGGRKPGGATGSSGVKPQAVIVTPLDEVLDPVEDVDGETSLNEDEVKDKLGQMLDNALNSTRNKLADKIYEDCSKDNPPCTRREARQMADKKINIVSEFNGVAGTGIKQEIKDFTGLAHGLNNGDITLDEFNNLIRDLCQQMANANGTESESCKKAGVRTNPSAPILDGLKVGGVKGPGVRPGVRQGTISEFLYGPDKKPGGGQLRPGAEGAINAALGDAFQRLSTANCNYRARNRSGGFGVTYGQTTAVGTLTTGIAYQNSVSIGFFREGRKDIVGVFYTTGIAFSAMSGLSQYTSVQSPTNAPVVIGGLYTGTGLSGFGTNSSYSNFLGAYDTINFNYSVPSINEGFSSQIAYGGGSYVFSIGAPNTGPGFGLEISAYPTTTYGFQLASIDVC
jgi:hypothetical protein